MGKKRGKKERKTKTENEKQKNKISKLNIKI